jgi:hypothetical protein
VSGFPTFVFGSGFPTFVFGSVFFSQPVRHKHKANKARQMGFIEYLVVSKEICGGFIVATRQLGQQAHRVSDDRYSSSINGPIACFTSSNVMACRCMSSSSAGPACSKT